MDFQVDFLSHHVDSLLDFPSHVNVDSQVGKLYAFNRSDQP